MFPFLMHPLSSDDLIMISVVVTVISIVVTLADILFRHRQRRWRG